MDEPATRTTPPVRRDLTVVAGDDVDERRLVRRVQRSGDMDAFGVLFRRHVEAVHGFAWRRSGSAEVADDVTSSVFERALRTIRTFRSRTGGLRAWLMRIASDELVATDRRNAAAAPSADARSAMDRLDPGSQQVIALRYLARLSIREVAVVMRTSTMSVAVVLHRALRALPTVDGQMRRGDRRRDLHALANEHVPRPSTSFVATLWDRLRILPPDGGSVGRPSRRLGIALGVVAAAIVAGVLVAAGDPVGPGAATVDDGRLTDTTPRTAEPTPVPTPEVPAAPKPATEPQNTPATRPPKVAAIELLCRGRTFDAGAYARCTWSNVATANVRSYRLWRAAEARRVIFRSDALGPWAFTDRLVRPGAIYGYHVDALDRDGRIVASGGPVRVTIPSNVR